MRNYNIKTFLTVLLAFCIGSAVNNFAISASIPGKIAVVDVNKVVAESSQVKALKKEQETKSTELKKWIETVRADVNKQSTQENKEKLTKKYDADLVKKQEAIKKDYDAKLKKIDADISNIIANEAKAKNYDMVLSKNIVLFGGTDITSTITKLVK